MDFVRWIYYYFMIYTKIADTYRYEQFIKKYDWIYEFEMLMHSVNLNSSDKQKVKENFLFVLKFYFCFFFARKIHQIQAKNASNKLDESEPLSPKLPIKLEALELSIINNLNIDPDDDIDDD